ncbi:hypothetical protein BC941DRAFT_516933 [Chlamydoabsidia padenii]|nr:hypothetical protein BC941DRAFT_516933 [Chlamydoabsidia padenii]
MVVTPFRGLEQKVSSVAKLNLHLLTTGTSKVDYYWAYIRRSPIGLNHCMDWKVITEFLWFEDRSMYVTVDAINDVIVAKCSVFGQRMVFQHLSQAMNAWLWKGSAKHQVFFPRQLLRITVLPWFVGMTVWRVGADPVVILNAAIT